jgi:hypothetical protein
MFSNEESEVPGSGVLLHHHHRCLRCDDHVQKHRSTTGTLHNPEYPDQGTVIIFHKHKASHPYEQEFLPVKLLSFQGASPLLMWEV